LGVRIAESADVDDSAWIGDGSSIWHLAQVRERARLRENCILGRGAYIGSGVTVGDNCKIQNGALVYEPAELADGVFIGPAVVLTNDQHPRAINRDDSTKSAPDWEAVGVAIGHGASIGARSVCVAPVEIGAWALVAAGSVVTKDVPAYGLVAGVPARRIGWVGKTARRLVGTAPDQYICPDTHARFVESEGRLQLVEETEQ
jgi:UDP-2-acetamido-3-amino-2,3-dideoxy-glucuronate N-acetyltransferase